MERASPDAGKSGPGGASRVKAVRRNQPVGAIRPLLGDYSAKDPDVAHLRGGHGEHFAVQPRKGRRLAIETDVAPGLTARVALVLQAYKMASRGISWFASSTP